MRKLLLSIVILLSLLACNKEPADMSNTIDSLSQARETATANKDYGNEEIPYEAPSESYELVKATCYGNNQLVKELLEKDISIINKESFFPEEETTHTPLSCALTGTYKEGYTPKHREVVKTLLEYGVDVNQPDPSGQDPMYCTPLQLAVRANDLEVAKLLIDHGADVNLTVRAVKLNNNGTKFIIGGCRSALEIAEKKENVEMIELLLSAGADKNKETNEIILRTGQKGEYTEIVELLKQAGGSVITSVPNAQQKALNEALIEASRAGNLEKVKAALAAGANVNSEKGQALLLAVQGGHAEIVKFLLMNGVQADSQGPCNSEEDCEMKKDTPLMIAVLHGYTEIVKSLLAAGADVNAMEDGHGYSALKCAVEGKYPDIVKLLIAAGANVNMQVGTVGCPVIRSVDMKDSEILKILLDAGADVNLECLNPNEDTALIHAVYTGNAENVALLINAGADVNAKGHQNRTPLSIASQKGDPVIISILTLAGAME